MSKWVNSIKGKKDILISGFSFNKEHRYDFGDHKTAESLVININKGDENLSEANLKEAMNHIISLIPVSKEKDYGDWHHCMIMIANNVDLYPQEPVKKLLQLGRESIKFSFIGISCLDDVVYGDQLKKTAMGLVGRYFNVKTPEAMTDAIQYVIENQTIS